jgi:hypothetical protein
MDPHPHGFASILVGWIRIRIGNADPDVDPGGQKIPSKIKNKVPNFMFVVLNVLRAECVSCSVDVLHGGLGILK